MNMIKLVESALIAGLIVFGFALAIGAFIFLMLLFNYLFGPFGMVACTLVILWVAGTIAIMTDN